MASLFLNSLFLKELFSKRFQIFVLSIVGILWFLPVQAQMEVPSTSDVRVLIDISGSMKKNDPKNLRKPALNLITELLPEGNSAGVWTFGQYVNELVKHQQVTAQWRNLAREKSNEISSVALFTNIGEALEKSSADLKGGEDYSNTHFILLTDGVVDISKTPGANVTERERILTKVLPKFKSLGARIHTVALSKNADQSLLQNISVETDGIYALAETSDELSKVFLQALQTAAPAEEIPLEDNKFDVDSSIEEFTALIFRSEEDSQTAIIEPTGEKFTVDSKPEYVRWFREVGYDLITVSRPLEGEWQLEAELAPGSRVTVVSNLKMVMKPLPSNFYAGDQLEIQVAFFEDGEQVLNSSFLGLVAVDVTIKTEDNKSGTKRISKDGEPPADGIFREKVTKLKDVGRYEVSVLGDGRTFRRQIRQLINLNAPMAVDLEATGTGEETRYRVVVNALSSHIDNEKTSIISKVKGPDGSNLIKSVPFNPETGRWELDIEPTKGDGIYELNLRVEGVTTQGGNFRFDPEVISAEFPRQEASPNEFRSLVDQEGAASMNEALAEATAKPAEPEAAPTEASEESIVPPIPEEVAQQAQAEQEAAMTEEEKPKSSKRTIMYIVAAVGGGVVVLSLIGLGVWAFLKKRKEQKLLAERTGAGSREPRTLKQEEEAKEVAKAKAEEDDTEPDLEDEIEQLENPAFDMDEAQEFGLEDSTEEAPKTEKAEETQEAEDDTDNMEFSLEDSEMSEPEPPEEPEPLEEPEPAQEPELPEEPETGKSAQDEIDELLNQGGADKEPTVGEKSAEELADEILKSNESGADPDDEFNLEDFDISDTDDLPSPEDDKKS
ncbi:VWA domain-containing protein [Hahella ganghwensis]|uniref:VWA domain-containing protein n=1 Tax=Hahella ganghwensis TaxID=286420 RepID=UPI001FDF032F|nr:VWA domain-containing protein [Hahella ganghwensis]